jgi:hypothetical protein
MPGTRLGATCRYSWPHFVRNHLDFAERLLRSLLGGNHETIPDRIGSKFLETRRLEAISAKGDLLETIERIMPWEDFV